VSARLLTLALADAPQRWAALGFTIVGGSAWVGGVELRLGQPGTGIVGWALDPPADIDGLAVIEPPPSMPQSPAHGNGALTIDHVVVVTADFERTSTALSRAGMDLRRIREVPERGIRQGFRRLGPVILELVEAPDTPAGPARFWGLAVVVASLEALAERLGEHLGTIRPAVQAGRRIATLRPSAGLGEAVAFMDPDPEAR
jgi:hypothetical protein